MRTHRRTSRASSIAEDVRYACRQLLRRRLTSAAAIGSLALAIGACLAAFQLLDALLVRPLPITGPERLYAVSHLSADANGRTRWIGAYEYPLFERVRDAARPDATLLAASPPERFDVVQGPAAVDQATVQFVTAALFPRFGLRPAAGRLFTAGDDGAPGAGARVALLSHDYWLRRFGGDAGVVGRALRVGDDALTIVGVVERGFTGTETGTVTDLFVPATVHRASRSPDDSWLRILVHLEPGGRPERLLDRLLPVFTAFREERARGFRGVTQEARRRFLAERIRIAPAPAGVSGLQEEFRRPLLVLGLLVVLVLGIACANVANLQVGQAAVRARELAVRAALGAGRGRLVQSMAVESLLIAAGATGIGLLFAAWASRFVLAMLASEQPIRLDLAINWRLAAAAAILALAASAVSALAPASRSAFIRPVQALGSRGDTGGRRRLAPLLIGAQAAFSAIVLVIAGLFVATFDRLAHQPMGFDADRVVLLDAYARQPQPLAAWEDARAHLAGLAGVDRVALAAFPLLSGRAANGFVSVRGGVPEPTLTYFLGVSPGWLAAMGVRLVAGRDFHDGDARPGAAVVNQAFADAYFGGRNPVGQPFERTNVAGRFTIVGVVADARYRDLRGTIQPTAYLPFRATSASGRAEDVTYATFVVRVAAGAPSTLAASLRTELQVRQPALIASAVRTQADLVRAATRRERLLSALGVFFASVALLLAGVGLYAVLDEAVARRRREIGIRLAVGAGTAHVVRVVAGGTLVTLVAGAAVGWAAAVALARALESVVYDVRATDPSVALTSCLALAAVAGLAIMRPALRAARLDPARTLRA